MKHKNSIKASHEKCIGEDRELSHVLEEESSSETPEESRAELVDQSHDPIQFIFESDEQEVFPNDLFGMLNQLNITENPLFQGIFEQIAGSGLFQEEDHERFSVNESQIENLFTRMEEIEKFADSFLLIQQQNIHLLERLEYLEQTLFSDTHPKLLSNLQVVEKSIGEILDKMNTQNDRSEGDISKIQSLEDKIGHLESSLEDFRSDFNKIQNDMKFVNMDRTINVKGQTRIVKKDDDNS